MIFEFKNTITVDATVDLDIPMLTVSGPLDLATIDTLRTELAVILDRAPRGLVLDLTDVDFLASVGIQLLVDTHHKFGTGNFVIVARDRAVIRPLALTHLDDQLRIVPSSTEALDAVRSRAD